MQKEYFQESTAKVKPIIYFLPSQFSFVPTLITPLPSMVTMFFLMLSRGHFPSLYQKFEQSEFLMMAVTTSIL